MTAENEEWIESPAGPDPRRLLTTFLELTNDAGMQVSWNRNDRLSHLVPSPQHDNFMDIRSLWNRSVHIDNLDYSDPRNPVVATAEFPQASAVGFKLEDIASKPVNEWEQFEMHNWLRGESDPWSVTTIKSLGKSQARNDRGEVMDNHEVYEIKLYRRSDDTKKKLVLTARLDFATGQLQRVDSGTDTGAPYSKIYAWIPSEDGRTYSGRGVLELKKYGIDNRDVAESRLYIPELRRVNYVGL